MNITYVFTAGCSQEEFALVVCLRTTRDVDESMSISSSSLFVVRRFAFFFFGGEVEPSLSDPDDKLLFRTLVRRIFGLPIAFF